MKEILKTRVAFYVGFGVMYAILSEIVGFEYTVIWCLGTIIGEQAFSAKERANQLILSGVSQQRELLLDFWMKMPKTHKHKGVAEHYIDNYLKSN